MSIVESWPDQLFARVARFPVCGAGSDLALLAMAELWSLDRLFFSIGEGV